MPSDSEDEVREGSQAAERPGLVHEAGSARRRFEFPLGGRSPRPPVIPQDPLLRFLNGIQFAVDLTTFWPFPKIVCHSCHRS